MSTTECFYSPDGTLNLSKAEINHIVKVKRYQIGDVIEVVDGKGLRIIASITNINPFELENVERTVLQNDVNNPKLTLVLALIKGKYFEYAVQMAVELGVDEIIPWQSERTIVKWNKSNQIDKLKNLVVVASKQSRRAKFPDVRKMMNNKNLTKYLKCRQPEVPQFLPIVLYEHSVNDFANYQLPATSQEILLIIGPEGGITDAEIHEFRKLSVIDISVGAVILRTATAVAKGLSWLSCYRLS